MSASALSLYRFRCKYFLYQLDGTTADVDLEIYEKEAKGTISFSKEAIPPRVLASSSTANIGNNILFGQLSSPRFGMRRNSSAPPPLQDKSGKVNFRDVKQIKIDLHWSEGFVSFPSMENLTNLVVDKILNHFPKTKKKNVFLQGTRTVR